MPPKTSGTLGDMAELRTTKNYHLTLTRDEYNALFKIVDLARNGEPDFEKHPLNNVYVALLNPDQEV